MNSEGGNALVSFGDCPKAKKSKTWNEQTRSKSDTWAFLPSVVVYEIFDLLSHNDRLSAASVCRNWRQNLYHPKWWITMTFRIKRSNVEMVETFTSIFAKIVTNVRIEIDILDSDCMIALVQLFERLSLNNNLAELMLEPSHCRFNIGSLYRLRLTKYNTTHTIDALKHCMANLSKFSIGCIEEFAHYIDEFLTIFYFKQPQKLTHLGLATIKDDPNEYEYSLFNNELIKVFTNLKVISIDYDQLSDVFLQSLDNATNLERLIVHLHGMRDYHPGTSNHQWRAFNEKHPQCRLRLNVIHSFEEVKVLQQTVLKSSMPLSHLKVFFCENVNMDVLEYVARNYSTTITSIMWVDSLSTSRASWSFFSQNYETSPDPLITISWLCKNLDELVFYGYKYCAANLCAIARLRGDNLKHLEFAEADILSYNTVDDLDYQVDIPFNLKKSWHPIKTAKLHPVIRNPISGDSDEYMLPIVLADLH